MHLLLRTESSVDVESALYSYMNEFDYYAFLGGVLEKPEQEPGEVARHLERVQGLLHNRTNAVSGYAGSKRARQSIARRRTPSSSAWTSGPSKSTITSCPGVRSARRWS